MWDEYIFGLYTIAPPRKQIQIKSETVQILE